MKIPFTNLSISLNIKRNQIEETSKKGVVYGSNYGRNALGRRIINAKSLYTIYRSNGDLYGCIREWRENVGAEGLQYKNSEDAEKPLKPTTIERLDSVFNYGQPFSRTKGEILQDMGISGNAPFEIVKAIDQKTVLGIARLDPRTVAIVSDEHGDIIKYIQRGHNYTPILFNPDEIIHFKYGVDPDNEVFGLSPLEPIILEALTDKAAKESNYAFYENDATPGVWYILEEGFSPEEQKKVLQNLKDEFQGPRKRGKPTVLEGVKDIKSFMLSQKDMEFLNGRKFITEKISAAYGVPKFLLGYTEGITYSNGKWLLKKAYKGTFQPLEENLETMFNENLIPLLKLDEPVEVSFIPSVFDEQEELEKRGLEEVKNGALTRRQYKQKTYQEVTKEDEEDENFDKKIIQGGSSAVLLEDVGVDPVFDEQNEEQTNKIMKAIKTNFSNDEK